MQVNDTLSPSMSLTFKDFLFNKKNRVILLMALGFIIIQLFIFKYLYPFASYIYNDSFSYIQAADKNLDINIFPIGYSRFLRLFSVFTHSDTAVVAFQYVCIQVSALFLLFTIFYFYTPGKIMQYVLLAFMVLNPLFLHLANLVSSDCLFATLSLTWFTLLLWIVHRPSTKVIIWHTLVLFLAFVFRSHAIVYPFIAVVAFGLARLPLKKKIAGVAAGICLCSLFVCYTSYKHKQLTGYWQFSPFSGWLMANNAMYSYRYVDSTNRKPVPERFQALDNMIREYFDSTRDVQMYPAEAIKAGTDYMNASYMPLPKYQIWLFANRKDSATGEGGFKKWASMGPFYRDYGLYIIEQNLWYFVRYFAWPNAQKYYAPPVEFLEHYNSGNRLITPEMRAWFGYTRTEVKTRMSNSKIWIFGFYPILCGTINLVTFFGLIYYVLLKGWQSNHFFYMIIVMGSAVWLLDALFTIVTSSAALRLQVFPVLVTTTLALLLVDWMVQLMRNMKRITQSKIHYVQGMGEELPESFI